MYITSALSLIAGSSYSVCLQLRNALTTDERKVRNQCPVKRTKPLNYGDSNELHLYSTTGNNEGKFQRLTDCF